MTITAATWLYVWVVIHYTVKDSFFCHGKIYAVSDGFVGYVEMFDLDASKWITITAVVVSMLECKLDSKALDSGVGLLKKYLTM